VIRYAYLKQLQPPAPFINVALRNPVTGAELATVPAQLDSAADRTLVPQSVVQGLDLPQIGQVPIGGVGGLVQHFPTYPVTITIHDLPAETIEVVASAGEAWLLLGRDVINGYRILLDGPNLALEIG
jgi:hypothetical protein